MPRTPRISSLGRLRWVGLGACSCRLGSAVVDGLTCVVLADGTFLRLTIVLANVTFLELATPAGVAFFLRIATFFAGAALALDVSAFWGWLWHFWSLLPRILEFLIVVGLLEIPSRKKFCLRRGDSTGKRETRRTFCKDKKEKNL